MPWVGSASPSARTPGMVRTSAAISRAFSSGASISTLKAASGGRAATSVAPAVGCDGGPKSGVPSPPGRRNAARVRPPASSP